MAWATQAITILLTLLFNIYVIRALRREQIDYKYALVWLSAGIMMLIFAIFPALLSIIATTLGIGLPLNMLFFLAILFLLIISFRISITIADLKRRIYTLTQTTAILENKIANQKQEEN